MKTFDVQSSGREQAVDITDRVRQAVREIGMNDGIVTVFTPHTTCGLVLNENSDPALLEDLFGQLCTLVPWKQAHYKHAGGNSAAHIKTMLVGSTLQLIVKNGALQLGTWQGLFLFEFDGPRIRHIWVQ